jgi:hypothetical protein
MALDEFTKQMEKNQEVREGAREASEKARKKIRLKKREQSQEPVYGSLCPDCLEVMSECACTVEVEEEEVEDVVGFDVASGRLSAPPWRTWSVGSIYNGMVYMGSVSEASLTIDRTSVQLPQITVSSGGIVTGAIFVCNGESHPRTATQITPLNVAAGDSVVFSIPMAEAVWIWGN